MKQQPRLQLRGAELRQGRLSGSRYSLHPLRVSQGLLGTKEQKLEAQLWTTGLLLVPHPLQIALETAMSEAQRLTAEVGCGAPQIEAIQ